MFQSDRYRYQKAGQVAKKLSGHQAFLTHGRHIGRDQAKRIGLVIDDLEADQLLQDLVLSVFHAANLTFQTTGAIKIIENHMGRAYIRSAQPIQQPPPPQLPGTPAGPSQGPPGSP
jgi:hypothetical protein